MRPANRISLYVLPAFTFLLSNQLTAQNSSRDSSRLLSSIRNTEAEYRRFIGTAAPLYSGAQYVEYYLQINDGHPFFLNTDFNMGSVHYENILYDNILLKYDIIENKIVLMNASGVFRLSPSNDKIDYFTILEHRFIRLSKDSVHPGVPKAGFYEELFRNSDIALLKKEHKSIQEDLNIWVTPRRYVESSINYYVEKKGAYYTVNRKAQVLELFKDKKAEVRQFIRKNNLDFKKDTDHALVSVVSYYESLIQGK